MKKIIKKWLQDHKIIVEKERIDILTVMLLSYQEELLKEKIEEEHKRINDELSYLIEETGERPVMQLEDSITEIVCGD